ncbi:hypothetical protein ABIE26_000376 [Pedobacter africanus]|uniref:Uncharacterized protein n=1 Tax=Pedobacter africanus TaxID=151894 RepID=A0ACC6KVN6_9SPHI|nr:hypothetical protein [Pedobacter africanus]MDR6783136.1 hypothetical protein [Pedobacter africanus]
MKRLDYILIAGAALINMTFASCTKESEILPSEELGLEQLFKPKANANPIEKELYENYGVWVRTEFTDSREVYNAYLGQDVNNARYPAVKVDEDKKESAYIYMKTLLSNISKDYVKQVMPNEVFFIKTYGHPLWGYQFYVVGRNRLAFAWPNTTYGSQPVVDANVHYYKDSVLTREVWRNLSDMVGSRIPEEIPDFEKIGKPYDGGTAFTKIRDQYFIDYDLAKRNREWQALADQGGYLDPYASFSFKAEYAAFFKLILLESYENIDKQYLKGNDMRRQKYNLFVKYFKDKYNWDIQATGNKYRQELNKYK